MGRREIDWPEGDDRVKDWSGRTVNTAEKARAQKLLRGIADRVGGSRVLAVELDISHSNMRKFLSLGHVTSAEVALKIERYCGIPWWSVAPTVVDEVEKVDPLQWRVMDVVREADKNT